MRILAVGDIHGHWCDFGKTVSQIHEQQPLDLVLQCGDAQPFRNEEDLAYMNCPTKYRDLGDFWFFHEGDQKFPVPCLLVGGNHEPWNWFDQMRDGGELTHNVEFLGRVGRQQVGNIAVAGVSGVYSPKYFGEEHLDWPYAATKKKQATYYNAADIDKLLDVGRVDILLLHEWPDLIFTANPETFPERCGRIGSEHLSTVLDLLQPRWCFCGHMHHPAQHRHKRTNITCLSDFHRDPGNACVILETETGETAWPLR